MIDKVTTTGTARPGDGKCVTTHEAAHEAFYVARRYLRNAAALVDPARVRLVRVTIDVEVEPEPDAVQVDLLTDGAAS